MYPIRSAHCYPPFPSQKRGENLKQDNSHFMNRQLLNDVELLNGISLALLMARTQHAIWCINQENMFQQ